MTCPSCKQEVYRYRVYYVKGELVEQCYACSSGSFPGLSTWKVTIDVTNDLVMSPAEYHYATHLVIGDGGVPYEDKTGKHIEKTLIGRLKKRMPN